MLRLHERFAGAKEQHAIRYLLTHHRSATPSVGLLRLAFHKGLVTVNGIAVEAAHTLRAGDLVEGTIDFSQLQRERHIKAVASTLQVKYEDSDIAVVWKPAGYVTAGYKCVVTAIQILVAL